MKAISLGVMACITWLVTGCGDLDNGSSRRTNIGADQQNLTSSNDHHASAIDSLALGPACGDGNLDPGEQCDDGNTADHDGCSAACTLELVTQFSFTGAAGTEVTFAADIADPELAIAPVMSRGAGITPSPATDAFSASGWTTGTTIDPGDFYSFTVAPAAGTAMNLRALQLDERRSATGIRSWSVRSSLDGFASDIAVFAVPDDTLTRTETASLPIQFHNLTTAVEFRIFGLQAEAATGTWRVDNVTLIGGVAPTCGNGIVDPGEQCDDGNTANGDGCENNCTLPACGNGIVDAGEQCDDGNLANHDGCSAACTLELVTQFSFTGAAGNEVTFAADIADRELATTPVMSRGAGVTPSTAVDAFSASGWTTGTAIDPGDFYSFTVAPAAGAAMNLRALQIDERRSATGIRSWSVRSSLDGFASDIAVFTVPDDTLTRTETASLPIQFHNLTTAVEFRIFGLQAEAATGTWRVDNVTLIGGVAPTCGNGIVDPGEQCDDGNTANGDGCENNCTLPACGNGIVDPGEQCDDGNTIDVDGCDHNCLATSITYLKASNTGTGDAFGSLIALSADGSTLAVAAPGEDSAAIGIGGNQADNSAQDAGAVYVFTRNGTGWTQQAYLKASNTGAGDRFGFSIALSADGSTLAVGAAFEASAATGVGGNQADNSTPFAGAVYVFTRNGTAWSQQAYIKASNTGEDDFGRSVALSANGSTLAVGAAFESSAATGVGGNQADNSATSAGAVYVFTRSGTAWSQQAYVKASNTESSDLFGWSVALSADGATLVTSALQESSAATGVGGNQADNSAWIAGAVYVFTRSGAAWSQQAYIKASNTDLNDQFGTSVALSSDGSVLAVGAAGEDSAATGVGGNQADNSASLAGAVYVFTRSGAAWSQQAYIKASNTRPDDQFGTSVALSSDGSILAVGALSEDSAAIGIGGTQTNNSAADSGAVYLFARSATTWSQRVYLKASNTGTGDSFGSSVALSADGASLAVGAQFESSAATGINGDQSNNSAFVAGAAYVFR